MRAHTEPLANAAQGLYSSLSIADAAVTSSFISGAIEPLAVRDRYNQAIGDASNALVTATYWVSSGDVESLQLLTEMSRYLAVYTDLIATARANDNVGNPVGVAYLREASALTQNTILPLAERLYAEQERAVAHTLTHTAHLPATAITVTTVRADHELSRARPATNSSREWRAAPFWSTRWWRTGPPCELALVGVLFGDETRYLATESASPRRSARLNPYRPWPPPRWKPGPPKPPRARP